MSWKKRLLLFWKPNLRVMLRFFTGKEAHLLFWFWPSSYLVWWKAQQVEVLSSLIYSSRRRVALMCTNPPNTKINEALAHTQSAPSLRSTQENPAFTHPWHLGLTCGFSGLSMDREHTNTHPSQGVQRSVTNLIKREHDLHQELANVR